MKADTESLFVAVAQHNSFTQAATELGLSAAAVGKQIAVLEKHLGSTLFVRNTRNMRLTPSGRLVLESYSQILSIRRTLQDELSEDNSALKGIIRLTTMPVFGRIELPRIIASFQANHPEVRFSVNTDSDTVDLVGKAFDLAIRYGELKNSELVAKKLMDNPLMITCSPDYLIEYEQAHQKIKKMQDLVHARMVVPHGYPLIRELMKSFPVNFSLQRMHSLTSEDSSVLVESLVCGIGFGILPYMTIRTQLEQGTLLQLLPKVELPCFPVSVVYPKSKSPKRVRKFIEHLVEHLP